MSKIKIDKKKLFVVTKYILALSASQAIQIEKHMAVDEVWVDKEWKNIQSEQAISPMGFISEK